VDDETFDRLLDRIYGGAVQRAIREGPKLGPSPIGATGPWTVDATEAHAPRLQPHLQRAERLRQQFGDLAALVRLGWAALDRLTAAVMAVDADGAILHANAAAEALLAVRDGLLREPGGRRLWAVDPRETERIMRLLDKAVDGGRHDGGPGGALNVHRAGRRPLALVVTPLAAVRTGDPPRAALLFVTDPEDDAPQSAAAHLAALYRLTPAERRLVAALIGGLALAGAATLLGLSRDTLKTQLRSVFTKTGTRRQSELLALAARLATVR